MHALAVADLGNFHRLESGFPGGAAAIHLEERPERARHPARYPARPPGPGRLMRGPGEYWLDRRCAWLPRAARTRPGWCTSWPTAPACTVWTTRAATWTCGRCG
jgi:hypothetical protein